MLEVCVDSFESALNAIHGGADELEVCSSLSEGGLTPSAGLVKLIIEVTKNIPSKSKRISERCAADCDCVKLVKKPKVNVLLRCRTGTDFCYSQVEMDTMLADLQIFKDLDVDRFVFGALTQSQRIDKKCCEQIVQNAQPLPVTFHRAFDLLRDQNTHANVQEVVELGFDRILTSGKQATVDSTQAMENIKELLSESISYIGILPGGGLNVSNIKVYAEMGCHLFHSSCKIKRELKKNELGLTMGTNDSDHIYVTDRKLVRELKDRAQWRI